MKDCMCSVYGCGSRRIKNPSLTFHTFPREGSFVYVRDEQGVEKKMDRKRVWEMILLMKTSAHHHRVCSLHFSPDDYYLLGYSDRCKLRGHAIPTLNLPQQTRRKEPKKLPCMVHGCDYKGKIFPMLAPKQNFPNPGTSGIRKKWNLWLQAVGLPIGANEPTVLNICDNHFVSGKPSHLVNNPDYVPSINVVNESKRQIEDITLKKQHTPIIYTTITKSDPLGMNYEELEPYSLKEESPDSDEVIEDLIKIEPMDFDFKMEA